MAVFRLLPNCLKGSKMSAPEMAWCTMITRLEQWFEELFQRRWFEGLLIASVIYAAAWLFFLPRGIVADLILWYAVALWLGVLTVVVLEILLAAARSFRQNFLPWDGHERRMRERRPAELPAIAPEARTQGRGA
jgi:hypothetical protein